VAHLSWDKIYDSFVQTLRNVLENHNRQFLPVVSPLVSGLPAQERLPHAHESPLL